MAALNDERTSRNGVDVRYQPSALAQLRDDQCDQLWVQIDGHDVGLFVGVLEQVALVDADVVV